MVVRDVADALMGVVLAPQCAACKAVLEEPTRGCVCESCWNRIRPLPSFLGSAADGGVARWGAAGEYEGSLREIIHAFKYDDRRSLARPLGRRLRAAGADVLEGASCVIPVPLHPWRRFRRGFNQAALLAAPLGAPVVNALWRTGWTSPQAGLPRDARLVNVRGAFALSPLVSRRRLDALIAGRIVVVVDDVRTTGATLEACAAVLIQAGAGEVRALTAGAVIRAP